MEDETVCSICGKSVSGQEAEAGFFSERDGKFLCANCLQALERKRKEARNKNFSESHERLVLLRSIEEELKSINNYLAFKEFSIWNVFGGIAQAFVFFLLFLAYRAESIQGYMAAAVIQFMALTFFVLGKK